MVFGGARYRTRQAYTGANPHAHLGGCAVGALACGFMPRFTKSAFRHGLSERDIQRALDDPFSAQPITTRQGNPGLSVEGLSASLGLPIEVFGEYDPETGDLVVYHAQWL